MRYFSGEDCDFREYKRWKLWATNRMMTMDKLPKEARGSFVWTLLQGKALEVVEHLKPEQYQIEGGEKVLFELLEPRGGSWTHCRTAGSHLGPGSRGPEV